MEIRTLRDVQQAEAANRWLRRPEVDAVHLDIGLDERECALVQSRIENLFNDCGCFWGPPALALTFFGVFVPQWLQFGFAWGLFGRALLLGIAAAIAAKYLALYVSHVRLRRLLGELGEHVLLHHRN